MAYLELHIGQQASKKIPLGSTFTLGRGPGNNLRLSDQRASRHHARITHEGERFLLEDLHSDQRHCAAEHSATARHPN